MRTLISCLAVVVAAVVMDQAGAADEPPSFDIARNCKEETAASATSQTGKNCTTDETDARGQLAKRWSSFSASQKKSCIIESSIGEQSYVELLTCLEMASGQFGDAKK